MAVRFDVSITKQTKKVVTNGFVNFSGLVFKKHTLVLQHAGFWRSSLSRPAKLSRTRRFSLLQGVRAFPVAKHVARSHDKILVVISETLSEEIDSSHIACIFLDFKSQTNMRILPELQL